MKIGDLVRQTTTGRTVPFNALGIVLEEVNSQPSSPRWKIMWVSGNEYAEGGQIKETVGYGYGVEIVSENR